MITRAEAVRIADSIAPDFLHEAQPTATHESDARVIVAYHRRAADGVLIDLYVADVDRATASARVVPFIDVIDSLDGMRDLTQTD